MIHIKNQLIILAFFGLVLLTQCSQNSRVKIAVKDIEIEKVSIKRYESALFNIDTLKLQHEIKRLQADFKPFLDADISDTVNLSRIRSFISDTMVWDIYEATMDQYVRLDFLEEELTLAFKHIKFYFPDWQPPEVYSYVSGLLYEVPVGYNGRELIIALDMYLGEDFKLYPKIGMPAYRIKRMTKERIITDCMEVIIRSSFAMGPAPENLLDKMISEGKILHLTKLFLPLVPDETITGFTKNQLKWCKQNESNMWAYFIENELLFASDPLIIRRFVNDGPFTVAFGNESPARAALWVGWQITESFLERNKELTPIDLIMKQNAREILKASAYKPGRFGF